MIKAGIAIDNWKLPIFERHLTEAGYSFEQCPGATPDMLFLRVDTISVEELGVVVRAANNEAAETNKRKMQ